jgi:predicted Zn-dependent protease
LLNACGEAPRFGPFYAARAQVSPSTAVRDLKMACQVDPGQWRHGLRLAKLHLEQGDIEAAVTVTGAYARRFPTNGALVLLQAKALVAAGNYRPAADLLSALKLLPCEGNTEALATYREAHLMLALTQMKAGRFDPALQLIAQARNCPESLGVGKPYSGEVDERLEGWLTYQCHLRRRAPDEARQALDQILAFRPRTAGKGVGEIIRALALQKSGQAAAGAELLKTWQREEPSNNLAAWAAQMLSNRPSPPPAGLDGAGRVLAASLSSR